MASIASTYNNLYSNLSFILGSKLVGLERSTDEQARVQIEKLSDAERAESLQDLLRFLGHTVVGPINKDLKFEGPQRPTVVDSIKSSWRNRVTWIRTGNFSRMPVHVATDRGMPFMARAISSYVASFRSLSLSHSRHKAAQRGAEDGLLVTMPSKPSKSQKPAQVRSEPSVSASHEIRFFSKGGPFLKAENVEEEVSAVTEGASSINWSVLERPSVKHVKDKFPEARFIHFICHGVEDARRPRGSHLNLWKETRPGRGRVDRLFVSDIST